MKKCVIWIVASFVIVISVFVLVGQQTKTKISVRFDVEPIYNHFPSLPEAKEIQWGSSSSGGIGLSTVRIYIFAFYESDIINILEDYNIEQKYTDTKITPPFLPEILKEDTIMWKRIEESSFLFQEGIADYKKLSTKVYLNTEWNVLYIEAIGE